MNQIKDNKGFVSLTLCMYGITVCILIVFMHVILGIYKSSKVDVQDILMSSTIAALVMDLDEYDKYNISVIDVDRAYDIFDECMKKNLEYMPGNENIMELKIEKFVVYNVYGENDIRKYTYDNTGKYTMTKETHKKIKESTVYAEISFALPGIFGSAETGEKLSQEMSLGVN